MSQDSLYVAIALSWIYTFSQINVDKCELALRKGIKCGEAKQAPCWGCELAQWALWGGTSLH